MAPTLRFDATGKADNIAELVEAAGKRRLEPEEMARLQEACRNHEPWLEWAGKREQQWCVADPVALHIHERISTQAILRVARRENIQRNLFADPEQEYREAVQTGRRAAPPFREGRRPAAYWYKFADADSRRGQLTLELEEDRRDLILVNKLRADVKRWRNAGWEGATNVTKDLLRHWRRKDRPRRFFFCQLEAAETIIFLNEIRGYRRDGQRGKPRWNPEFTDADFDLLWKMADGSAEPLTRFGCKMATGSGKTVVMAMLITWAFCNRARVPSDDRFPNAVLVCCPNLTIKERLQVLRTDARGDDYYTQFDLVPPQYRDLLRTGKVLVTNWHFFAPESEHSEGGKSYAVVKKGEETDEAFARNRLGELFERGPIMVLNDEGHHAYRPAPISEKEAKTTTADVKKEREDATIWVQGLDRITKACGIRFCVDLSATPFYIKGSGYPEGEPFPVDRERLRPGGCHRKRDHEDPAPAGQRHDRASPIRSTSGSGGTSPRTSLRASGCPTGGRNRRSSGNGRRTPLSSWPGEYKKAFEAIEEASDTALKAPPVMIVVCDNTDIAQVFFENISGQTEVEEIPRGGRRRRKRNRRPRRKKCQNARDLRGRTRPSFPELFQNDPRAALDDPHRQQAAGEGRERGPGRDPRRGGQGAPRDRQHRGQARESPGRTCAASFRWPC